MVDKLTPAHLETLVIGSNGQHRCCATDTASNPRWPLLHGEKIGLVAAGRQYPGKADSSANVRPSVLEQSAPSGHDSQSPLALA